MNKKELYRMINEEISDFDFLGIANSSAEIQRDSILTSKEFQTNFMIDLINNSQDKSKFKKLSSTFINKDVNMFDDSENIEVEVEIIYCFEEKDYGLVLFLDGDKTEDNINYKNFNLKIFSKAGDEIKFDWVINNEKLYETLIRGIIQPFID